MKRKLKQIYINAFKVIWVKTAFKFFFRNAVLCIFLQRQTSKHSFLVEIEPAALNLLVNLEVKFLMNAEQAGLFFLCILLLSKRKREYWKWSRALPQQCRGWGCNKPRHKHHRYTLLNLRGRVSCCLTCRHKHGAHAFFLWFKQAPVSIWSLKHQHIFF